MLFLLAFVLGTVYYFISAYTIKDEKIYVEGNYYYTEQEIKDIVLSGPLGRNSLYLSTKYKNKGIETIPFVDSIEVTFVEKDAIRILVHEKSLAGYIEFMDSLLYFDKDGYVVEASNVKIADVPWVVGLEFDRVELGRKIPVQDDRVFEKVNELRKLLPEYDLFVDKIFFRSDLDIILFFGDVRVMLGDGSYLQEKIMVLPKFLPQLINEKGTLHMENYKNSEDSITFDRDMSENN